MCSSTSRLVGRPGARWTHDISVLVLVELLIGLTSYFIMSMVTNQLCIPVGFIAARQNPTRHCRFTTVQVHRMGLMNGK